MLLCCFFSLSRCCLQYITDKKAAVFGELQVYFTCEAAGNYPGKEECDRSRIDSFVFPILLNIAIYMFVAIPTVTLVYVISWRDMRTLIGKIFTSLANKTHVHEHCEYCSKLTFCNYCSDAPAF